MWTLVRSRIEIPCVNHGVGRGSGKWGQVLCGGSVVDGLLTGTYDLDWKYHVYLEPLVYEGSPSGNGYWLPTPYPPTFKERERDHPCYNFPLEVVDLSLGHRNPLVDPKRGYGWEGKWEWRSVKWTTQKTLVKQYLEKGGLGIGSQTKTPLVGFCKL